MSVESLRIHPAALEEAEAATDWYAQRSRRAAERFLDELDSAMDQISRNPGQFPSYHLGTRRTVLRRFPFVLVFREAAVGAEIIAIAHGHRRPGYWRDRLG
ncbi:MAG: type II toxin-antitoxin system RelE/ParE family toxin [Bryobacteraceae bacterium]